MTKLKMFAIVVVAAAMVAVAGIAASSASAQPRLSVCDGLVAKGDAARSMANGALATGNLAGYLYYMDVAGNYYERAFDCYSML